MIFWALLVTGASLSGCYAVDGDTIRCGRERIRLVGIDAPEMPGHCRHGRRCVVGDPVASRQSLSSALVGTLTIRRYGRDHYGRTLARVGSAQGDLSCWQLERRQAVFKPRWSGEKLPTGCAIKGRGQ
nr:thermonuclease family protein [uncultured Sphingomonas sp.]